MMRLPSALCAEPAIAPRIWRILYSLCIIAAVDAINFTPVQQPNLDLSQLGRVALAGDFDSINMYQYEGQSQSTRSTNGSQQLLTQYPNGLFATLQSADAHIQALCPFEASDGTLYGIIVGGNFTSLGGVEAQGAALYNPIGNNVTALPGLSGSVSALYCDRQSSTVYVGGSFTGANSTNAISWTTGWTNLPFAGFNGPVTSITKAANGNMIFGGSFNGLGNITINQAARDEQVVNLFSANITSGGSTLESGYSDPRNIICKTSAETGAGNSWLLANNTPGYWQATFGFGFRPTLLRLYNTQVPDYGTQTWRFTDLSSGGILEFTFTNASGQLDTCSAECPLPDNNSTYHDFRFVNSVGMGSFRIDISAWYGSGGGLGGIELFDDEIMTFAVDLFNEPACDNVSGGVASATTTGPWQVTPPYGSNSDYLTIVLNGSNIGPDSASVVFKPDIKVSGNYSVTIDTPGCIPDGTCSTRGLINLTGFMGNPTRTGVAPVNVELYQTNNYDKYDPIYYGYVDTTSGSFAPSITLAPAAGQTGPLTVVAQRVRFQLVATIGGLNGLYEYNPNQATVSTNFSQSVVDVAGLSLNSGASIASLAVYGDTTYAAGDFSSDTYNNILAINSNNSTSLARGGLNGPVQSMFLNGSILYFGGNFTSTRDNKTSGLNYVAAYSIPNGTWIALGAGVNGVVTNVVPITMNLTTNVPEVVITFSGSFTQVNAFGSNASAFADNFAVWVPSRNNWLTNLGLSTISISGQLTSQDNTTWPYPLFAGSITSGMGINDAATLASNSGLNLQKLPVSIQPRQLTGSSSLSKRAIDGENVTGIVTGLFYQSNGLDITILGGHFTATGSNGTDINNLVFVNGSNANAVSGVGNNLDTNSVFLALGYEGTTLFAGGTISGTVLGNTSVGGLILYDLQRNTYPKNQPPALQGANVGVNAIATRPGTSSVYIAGSFDSAGSFACPALCIWDNTNSQWNSPGNGLGGSVAALTWSNANSLILGGNLTVNGYPTSMATYDAQHQNYSAFDGATSVPGPVTALTAANDASSQFWVAGKSTNGTAFLERYNGSAWLSVGDALGAGTTIRGLNVLSLKQNHAATALLAANQILLVTGTLSIAGYGNASAALFNGTTFMPFLLSNTPGGAGGSLSQTFVQNPNNFFASTAGHLAVGFVVLIALAIALALIFLLVVLGILAERLRRRREGYEPAPTGMFERKHDNVERIPPEHLFGSIRGAGGGVGGGGGAGVKG